MDSNEDKFAYFKRVIFRSVAGLLVVAVVSVLRFIYSVGFYSQNLVFKKNGNNDNNLADKALGDKLANADVPGTTTCSTTTCCNPCSVGSSASTCASATSCVGSSSCASGCGCGCG